ncbi:hypothetical protein [Staphylococcus carnosus]|uniref:Uncharacterized protein n=1 Tax=Staphylococcus carnosus (strain TM300) TaxID=396513 RepID=B9DKP2_STACT|nr:hypothetical protein [Staphylococcus carnosus]QPT03369.1 hypothetical protein I6G40_09795 [Staphylococcus carnosus]UQA68374.1 hypothetical protein Sta3580_05830 [Staphylococcus carnosus]UTB79071.1 hypothetical protein A2I62_11080 [Staphylococcus carnosus]UTB88625.1 hypothetical protein A2I63_11080 [Staphylococcus carnosus]UTB90973.1 hypothetical protein A2I64_11075 [Staphylococcus carnosus]
MRNISIIRVLDEDTFFIDAGQNAQIQTQQFIEVLNPKLAYKNLAQVIDVYDDYSICKKLGDKRILFGDIVKPREVE